jgi:hypothetical protein
MDVLDVDKDYNMLSLPDLLAARDAYHLHLMAKQHVVGTAVGRYLIRKSDEWPKDRRGLVSHDSAAAEKKVKTPRTLANSEMRSYSWPCVLVFVDRWVDYADMSKEGLAPDQMVPRALLMPSGSRVPVCVVYAPPRPTPPVAAIPSNFPSHWVGGGFPIVIDVQDQERIASVGCLVTDGHLVYALTNRHVTGPAGTPVYTILGGEKVPIGKSSDKSLMKKRFSEVYPSWPGKNVFVNLDVGLIEIDDLNQWTANIYGVGPLGRLADVSSDSLSLRLIDAEVEARGAVSGPLQGRIKGLFYRYKSLGGFEYVAECLIGPVDEDHPLGTAPGDSGTLWSLSLRDPDLSVRPLAVQWGGQRFSTEDGRESPYALASFLSTACSLLDVDVVCDWNPSTLDYWGAVGHYLIAAKAIEFLPASSKLRHLMKANLERVSFAAAQISKKSTDGLSKHDFVPLADVPDLVWKIAKAADGGRGEPEHPNHFADMDAPDPGGKTLLELCQDPKNVAVEVWRKYYDRVGDKSRGLLPFRAWQFYSAMVKAVKDADYAAYVCAAGTLAHYVGDACQPLHISRLFDGDPGDTEMAEVYDRKLHKKVMKEVPRARGVHSAYEKDMVNYHTVEIVQGIDAAKKPPHKAFTGGEAAAVRVVELMQRTFTAVPPAKIVKEYQKARDAGKKPKAAADALWAVFKAGTITAMVDGCACLAALWRAAWDEGGGPAATGVPTQALKEDDLSDLYKDRDFVRSFTLDKIGPALKTHP